MLVTLIVAIGLGVALAADVARRSAHDAAAVREQSTGRRRAHPATHGP